MRRYPKEWPGFRVLIGGELVIAGAVVECIGIDESHHRENGRSLRMRLPRTHAGVRVLENWYLTADNDARHPDGWGGALIPWYQLEPLTPTAREWKRARCSQ